jgi:hypothetical protein
MPGKFEGSSRLGIKCGGALDKALEAVVQFAN